MIATATSATVNSAFLPGAGAGAAAGGAAAGAGGEAGADVSVILGYTDQRVKVQSTVETAAWAASRRAAARAAKRGRRWWKVTQAQPMAAAQPTSRKTSL